MSNPHPPKDTACGTAASARDLPDAELVAQSLAGDGAAFGRLVERYRPMVFSILTGRLLDVDDAEDEAQETFVLAFRRLHTLRTPSQFSSWIARIAVNRANTRLRGDARRKDVSAAGAQRDRPPDRAWGWRYTLPRLMAYEVVREAVGRLPEEPRSTLRMRFVDEATYPEIAATLGVPPRAAEKRVWRALSGLRARVDIS